MRRSVSMVFALLVTLLLAPPARSRLNPEISTYPGMCDASAAVAVGPTMFVVSNDEDNVLRVYQRNKSDNPVTTFDLTSFLKPRPRAPGSRHRGGHSNRGTISTGSPRTGQTRKASRAPAVASYSPRR